MSLAIFDLDNTLIADDSDYLWGQFLVDRGVVDRMHYEQANARYYQDYKQGTLDMTAFLRFALQPLADNDTQQLLLWREQFIREIIEPLLLKAGQELVDKHRNRGDTLLVITATTASLPNPSYDSMASTTCWRPSRKSGMDTIPAILSVNPVFSRVR